MLSRNPLHGKSERDVGRETNQHGMIETVHTK